MARQFNTSPANLLGIEDPFAAYCFNEIAYMWGVHVETELQEATQRIKPKDDPDGLRAENAAKDTLTRLLGLTDSVSPATFEGEKGKFRDPMEMLGGNAKVKRER